MSWLPILINFNELSELWRMLIFFMRAFCVPSPPRELWNTVQKLVRPAPTLLNFMSDVTLTLNRYPCKLISQLYFIFPPDSNWFCSQVTQHNILLLYIIFSILCFVQCQFSYLSPKMSPRVLIRNNLNVLQHWVTSSG